MRRIAGILFVLVLIGGGGYAGVRLYGKYGVAPVYTEYAVTEAGTRELRREITSTGTVEPEELVNVGAQIGGMIQEFGKDAAGNPVDFRSPVKAGQVLAKIDDSLYRAEVEIARALKLQAEAKLQNAEANKLQADAKFDLAKANWERAERLYPQGIQAKSEYDSARAEYASSEAAKAISDASVQEAKAQILSAAASLSKSERNLGYCVITSPVDGVIIDRRVNLGQTVNASMNAPSLFLIAKDLKRMQVWVSVNEADIGELKPGLNVLFTVDAFPGRSFVGTVKKVRLNATLSQNVVTYVVEIDTDNSSGILLPYLTANVKIVLEERERVLAVPNASLRFIPKDTAFPTGAPEGARILWVLRDDIPVPVFVRTGLNDGSHTEILSGLEPGEMVITGSRLLNTKPQAQKKESSAGESPFMPKPPQHNNRGSRKQDDSK